VHRKRNYVSLLDSIHSFGLYCAVGGGIHEV
jgi:hypothetical protein